MISTGRVHILVRIAAGIAALLILTGCAATVATEEVGPCSPSYEIAEPGVGSISIRQSGRGASIQWGLYLEPKFKIGTHFIIRVYAGGTVIDNKNQDYEPHASVGADRARKYSGQLLEIRGTATHGDDQLAFSAKCFIA